MKRQRNVASAAKVEDTTMVRKKNKRAVENVGNEAKNGIEWAPAVVVAENWLDWEELPLLTREVVDEQMSWGYFSLPIWGVEAYGSVISDLVWDDDIWNLKSIKEIPANP